MVTRVETPPAGHIGRSRPSPRTPGDGPAVSGDDAPGARCRTNAIRRLEGARERGRRRGRALGWTMKRPASRAIVGPAMAAVLLLFGSTNRPLRTALAPASLLILITRLPETF